MIVLLTRFDLSVENEIQASEKYFPCVSSRMLIPRDSLVIGRYSVLPYYGELEKDLSHIGSRLINSHEQHLWIADIRNWYPIVSEYTPETWFERWDLLPDGIPFVVKGKTNSRKWQWNTHMYAKDRDELKIVMSRLYDDTFISDQGLIVRKYIPLKRLETGLNGLPISNEWRFFFLGDREVDHGFYWSQAEKLLSGKAPDEAIELAQRVAKKVSEHTNFFVLDIAETESGEWVLIEINDAQMSGLSEIPAERFYGNLSRAARSFPQ